MNWFILFGLLAAFFIITAFIAYYFDEYSDYPPFGLGAAIICAVILACMGGSLININAHFDATIADYENTVALVETYNGSDYGNMPALTEKIIQINTEIARHRELCKSNWSGLWYSEKIGALEPITFNTPNKTTELTD